MYWVAPRRLQQLLALVLVDARHVPQGHNLFDCGVAPKLSSVGLARDFCAPARQLDLNDDGPNTFISLSVVRSWATESSTNLGMVQ